MTRTPVPGPNRGFGSSTNPARLRERISAMTRSGMRAGNTPCITSRRTPADHRAFYHPETISTKA